MTVDVDVVGEQSLTAGSIARSVCWTSRWSFITRVLRSFSVKPRNIRHMYLYIISPSLRYTLPGLCSLVKSPDPRSARWHCLATTVRGRRRSSPTNHRPIWLSSIEHSTADQYSRLLAVLSNSQFHIAFSLSISISRSRTKCSLLIWKLICVNRSPLSVTS